jgi:hypothetical protein
MAVNSWFLRNIDDKDTNTVREARLVVIFSLGTSAVALAYIPLFYYMHGPVAAVFLSITAILVAATGFVMRWTRSKYKAAYYYLFTVWVLITGTVLFVGGDLQPSLGSYIVIVLGATLLIGPRAGIFWTVICILTILAIQLVVRSNILVFPEISTRLMAGLYVSSMVSVLTVVCLFTLLYDRAKSSALNELRDVSLRIKETISQLGTASERLVHSSETFLGTQTKQDSGLVSQMMLTARAGRDSIETSRESITGMIQQYRHIATRVDSLYRYSQVIVDLVSVIDRISSRLDLMALNVGIEAARSGHAGRQFMILANDMRSMAERVITETSRIKSALQSILHQGQEVRESSNIGQILTEESAEKMSAMIRTLDVIYSLITETESATEKITADTLAQIDAVRRLITVAADDPSNATERNQA